MRHKIALVGAGASVNNHLAALKALDDRIDLVAAVDVHAERLRAVCEENGIAHCYTSLTEMLEAESPELVILVTPPATHKSLILECLEAGASVWCEKPLVASLADFDAIDAAERRAGRYVSTVFQWRFGSASKHLKNLIERGVLGRPLVGVCNTLWYRDQMYYNSPWHGKWQTATGGPTMTLGIHLMDLFLWLMGDWDEVQAMTGTLDRAIEVEDISTVLVRFAGGALGTIINSALSPRQESMMRLDFQRATVEVITLYRHNNQNWRFSQPPAIENAEVSAAWNELVDNVAGNHEAQLRDLLDSLERGERPLVSGAEARRILEFTASLYKAAATRQPVKRGEITPDDPFYFSMNGAAITGEMTV